jgi:hypothetical protein
MRIGVLKLLHRTLHGEGLGHIEHRRRIAAVGAYIPAEILAFYVPVVPAIELLKMQGLRAPLQWIMFFVSWVLVPAYFLWIGKGDDRRARQATISAIAFPIWAYATNREIGIFGSYYDAAGALILLLLFSLLTAFLLPKKGT